MTVAGYCNRRLYHLTASADELDQCRPTSVASLRFHFYSSDCIRCVTAITTAIMASYRA
jgi:hypothetical protein